MRNHFMVALLYCPNFENDAHLGFSFSDVENDGGIGVLTHLLGVIWYTTKVGKNESEVLMKRLYFLLPNPGTACQIVTELTNAGVRIDHMHAVATYGSELPCVDQATLLQTSQFGRGTKLGVLVGGLAGLLGGWLAMLYPPPSLEVGRSLIMLSGVLGAVGGAILGGMVARDRLNPEILPYEGAILRGTVLLMVDIPRHEIEFITNLVQLHHPEAIPHITPLPQLSVSPK
ncbi:hypothetical protein CCP3SC1_1170001 [Gammaproteobacteria bacterium]